MPVAVIGLVIAAAGTAMSAVASYQKAQAAADAQEAASASALAQAKIAKNTADYNALAYETDAFETRKTAAYNAAVAREKAIKLIGSQRLEYAVSGVEISSGSPLETMMQQTRDSELDTLANLYTAENTAEQYEKKARFTRYQGEQSYLLGLANANAYDTSASSTRTIGTISATSTILTGASKAATAYGGSVSTSSAGL